MLRFLGGHAAVLLVLVGCSAGAEEESTCSAGEALSLVPLAEDVVANIEINSGEVVHHVTPKASAIADRSQGVQYGVTVEGNIITIAKHGQLDVGSATLPQPVGDVIRIWPTNMLDSEGPVGQSMQVDILVHACGTGASLVLDHSDYTKMTCADNVTRAPRAVYARTVPVTLQRYDRRSYSLKGSAEGFSIDLFVVMPRRASNALCD